jgi:hypothetical protein
MARICKTQNQLSSSQHFLGKERYKFTSLIPSLSNNHPHIIRTDNLDILLNLSPSFLGTSQALSGSFNTAPGLRRKPSNAQKLPKATASSFIASELHPLVVAAMKTGHSGPTTKDKYLTGSSNFQLEFKFSGVMIGPR